ncbi:MAG: TonB-dependent receptor [Flavobacteriales bacterium]|nr:TonB-dependent receptor [Flavobacteriales bacterium]
MGIGNKIFFLITIVFIGCLNLCYALQTPKGTVEGQILSAGNNKPVQFCTVHITTVNVSTQTDEKGKFILPDIPYGSYNIEYFLIGFDKRIEKIVVDKPNIKIKTVLAQKAEMLKSVDIHGDRDGMGDMEHMRSIEGVLISEGKKNEVINVTNVTGNLAANQGRQIYAKIPGLNIWESGGSGIQLGIGGRGLNPSRTSNFNTRQDGYDISADALGYPESYYTPPAEAISKIQFLRGAAGLQFGTQFGGLVNFILHDGPEEEKFEVVSRNTYGSFGMFSSYLGMGLNKGKWKGYSYLKYRTGNEWRPNSKYNVYSGAINLKRELTDKTDLRVEYTKQYYLSQQPGGLTDAEFYSDPSQSKRARNWFKVDWNLAALSLDHKFSTNTNFKTQLFGLLASRQALGILGNISRPDNINDQRDLISGYFKNWGNETRLLHKYKVKDNIWAFLIGARYYQGYNLSKQGFADTSAAASFNYVDGARSRYEFPSSNIAVFTENILKLSKKFSLTPGVRFEHINTNAEGTYQEERFDLAGNQIFDSIYSDTRNNSRSLVIAGLGLRYNWKPVADFYSNISQNYRSINFTDMQIQNSNFRIDPNLSDETGYNFDLGVRGAKSNKWYYDASIFMLAYNNRIGEVDAVDSLTYIPYRLRTNISNAFTKGVEAVAEVDWLKVFVSDTCKYDLKTHVNVSFTESRYVNSDKPAFENKLVESVPPFNLKTGITFSTEKFTIAYQYSYVHEHYSDATNAGKDVNGKMVFIPGAIVGLIPSYDVMDLSFKYKIKRFQIETGINNLANELYFTRRATGYPGPGIIPSASRSFYITLQVKI